MKVANNNTQTNPAPDKASGRNDLNAPVSGELDLDGTSERPSFASVLDRMTQSRKEPKTSGAEHSRTSSTQQTRSKRDDEQQDDADALVVTDRVPARELQSNVEPETDVHTILPTEDLDRIVAACRVETLGGRPAVQIDLNHSVLEGLRVKVSVDPRGGVTTEFLAANEGIKNLLDARSTELMALLRSRGLNLVNFRSSLNTATYTGTDSGSRQGNDNRPEPVTNVSVQAVDEEQASDDIARGATYRA